MFYFQDKLVCLNLHKYKITRVYPAYVGKSRTEYALVLVRGFSTYTDVLMSGTWPDYYRP